MRARAPALLLALACGCTQQFDPCFSPAQKIVDLRVVAVRAEPPETVIDPAGDPVPEVEVTALVAVPPEDVKQELLLLARVCAPTADLQCPNESPVVARQVGPPGALAVRIQATLSQLLAARQADPLQGFGGIRLQVDLEVQGELFGRARASKVLLYTPARPGYAPVHGLRIPELQLWRRGTLLHTVSSRDKLDIEVGDRVGVQPILEPGPGGVSPLEDYDAIDLLGRKVRLRGRVTYELYTTAHAKFSSDAAEQPPLENPQALVDFIPTYQSSGRLYVVGRDGRGGVDWFTMEWFAADNRPDPKPSLEVLCK